MKETILSAIVALVVAIGAVSVLAPTSTVPSVGGIASPDVYSYMNVKGAFSQGGGATTVTPTAATVTLTAAQLRDTNVITFSASSTQPALTVTLPATSTFPIGVETGSYRSWVIENPYTGAATTTTIAAGAGIDLQEPDGQNVVVGPDNYAWLTCFREISSNIVCRVDESIPAD